MPYGTFLRVRSLTNWTQERLSLYTYYVLRIMIERENSIGLSALENVYMPYGTFLRVRSLANWTQERLSLYT